MEASEMMLEVVPRPAALAALYHGLWLGVCIGLVSVVVNTKFKGPPMWFTGGESSFSLAGDDSGGKHKRGRDDRFADAARVERRERRERRKKDDDASDDDELKEVDEDMAVRRFAKVGRVLGVSEQQVREAVRESNRQIRDGEVDGAGRMNLLAPRKGANMRSTEDEIAHGRIKMLEYGIVLAIVFGLLFLWNVESGGAVTRMVVALFPREASVLGIDGGVGLHAGLHNHQDEL